MVRRVIGAYTLAHFCVDFACHWAFFALFVPAVGAAGGTAALGALAYNGVAFALQPFIGVWCDTRRGVPIGLVGCLLLAAGVPLCAPAPWPGLLLCALGNACFHVGGGSDCLAASGGKMAGSGIFVSSGALGVALGVLSGKSGVPLWLPLAMVLGCALLLWRLRRPFGQTAQPFGAASGRAGGWVIGLCALSVVIRAYGGGLAPTGWAVGPVLALAPACAAAAGKAAGGFVADRLGARRTGVLSLCLAALLLGGFPGSAALCALGLFCFNLCMPITLCALSDRLPGYPGLAFGITTLGLFIGWLPLAFWGAPVATRWWVLGLCLLSAACLLAATTDKERIKL